MYKLPFTFREIRNLVARHCLKLYGFFGKTFVWSIIAVIALLVCIDIETQWFMISCKSANIAQVVNRVVLALSYSYIAAAVFHFVVVFCPFKTRQHTIEPFLNHLLFQLSEKIRQTYEVPISIFSTKLEPYTKDEYVSMFSSMDMFEFCIFPNGMTKLDRLNSLRKDINELITLLLLYREYIDEDTFLILNKIVTSNFMVCDIIPIDSVRDEFDDDKNTIGESIFEIHDLSKQLCRRIYK